MVQMPQKLVVDGQELAVLCFNPDHKGPPIILLHGLTHSIYAWWYDRFLWQYGRCYSLSLPGHPPATSIGSFDSSVLQPERLAALLSNAIQQLVGDQPVILMGLSTGGFAALLLAAYIPSRVQGVISLAGFAQGQLINLWGLCQWLARQGEAGQLLIKRGFHLVRLNPASINLGWASSIASPATLLRRASILQRLNTLMYPPARIFNLDILVAYFETLYQIDISTMLPNITAPTLIIQGEQDPIVPPTQGTHIARLVPQSTLVMVPHVGHVLFVEDPERYETLVGTRLAELTQSPVPGVLERSPLVNPLPVETSV
ncbi:MAG: alpha/beta hydrolase [Chloroflexaceae bacterium]|nr:alpha/beta hydrolase [Chloroflexaceae bacterium]